MNKYRSTNPNNKEVPDCKSLTSGKISHDEFSTTDTKFNISNSKINKSKS